MMKKFQFVNLSKQFSSYEPSGGSKDGFVEKLKNFTKIGTMREKGI